MNVLLIWCEIGSSITVYFLEEVDADLLEKLKEVDDRFGHSHGFINLILEMHESIVGMGVWQRAKVYKVSETALNKVVQHVIVTGIQP